MRVFIILSLIVALTNAAPQYGYEQPNDNNGGSSGHSGRGGGNSGGGNKYLPPPGTTQAPIINKKFYIISAPEDNSNDGKVKHLVLGRPQKNYRVVFIKAPAPDGDGVKYSAEFAPQEEKTVIYVLSKKGEDLDAGQIATPAPTQPSKPEVFFIKYKTDDEADQAQKEIQGEYDKLGGTNEVVDEGPAPITSVVGSLGGLNPDGSYNYHPINKGSADLSQPQSPSQSHQPSTQYLPSLFRH